MDTYALVEMAKGNPKFTRFNKETFAIADVILAEFYGVLLREYDEQTAEYWFRKMSPYARQVPKELLKEAVKFKFENTSQNFSFFNAVGYIYSLRNGHNFLTGDTEFEGMPNVEFVRK